jgi:GTP cyclohydrolase I
MPGASDLVLVRDIATTVVCPHHLLPASGVAHVAYVARGRVVGLGAVARLVDCFARRLTLQEVMSRAVADALVDHLGASAAGCVADLSPACLTARGERRHGARVVTFAVAGDAAAKRAVEAVLAPLATGASDSDATGDGSPSR